MSYVRSPKRFLRFGGLLALAFVSVALLKSPIVGRWPILAGEAPLLTSQPPCRSYYSQPPQSSRAAAPLAPSPRPHAAARARPLSSHTATA
eukprot:scaffold10082_cov115-Isochrysis_galbana.AAC.4